MTTLYILCGLPFSGKSTLAQELVKKFGFTRIDLDEIKFELFGKAIQDKNISQTDWDKIYQEMYKRIEATLKEGKTVIHDTGNFTKQERDLVKQIAEKLNIESITIFVDTPLEVAKERLVQNRKTNQRFDIPNEEFESVVREMEVPSQNEKHIVYNYGTSIENWLKDNTI